MCPHVLFQYPEHVECCRAPVREFKKPEPARITSVYNLPGILRIRMKKDRDDGR